MLLVARAPRRRAHRSDAGEGRHPRDRSAQSIRLKAKRDDRPAGQTCRMGARPAGVRSVEIRIDARLRFAGDDRHRPARCRAREAGLAAKRSAPASISSAHLSSHPAPAGVDRRGAIRCRGRSRRPRDRARQEKRPSSPPALARAGADLSGVDPTPFHLLPALSGIPLGGAQELDTEYTAYLSSTMRAGMRVPILYMRQTKGAAGDYAFDPDWDIATSLATGGSPRTRSLPRSSTPWQKQLPVLRHAERWHLGGRRVRRSGMGHQRSARAVTSATANGTRRTR